MPGTISPDRAAISGNLGFLDLFEGGNLYYQGYVGPHNSDSSMVAVNTIASLRTSLSSSLSGLLYAVVPSKASCLPENYPLLLPNRPTSVFTEIRDFLGPIAGHVFFEEMLCDSLYERQRRWLQTDSHWSSHGAHQAAASLLAVLGIPAPLVRDQHVDLGWGGDLCGRWGEGAPFALEDREVLLGHDQAREAVFDNGNGLIHSANIGRLIHWNNKSAPVQANLVVIGGSSSGTGHTSEHLTYWLSMVFSNTYFLHSPNCPTDLLQELSPDFLLLQTTERFLQFPYVQTVTLGSLKESFARRIAEKK